jgi:hypothetical protein
MLELTRSLELRYRLSRDYRVSDTNPDPTPVDLQVQRLGIERRSLVLQSSDDRH